MTDFPKYGLWRGRRVRILYYVGDGKFRILDRNDDQWTVLRTALTFTSTAPRNLITE
jgi:hypothetical protein